MCVFHLTETFQCSCSFTLFCTTVNKNRTHCKLAILCRVTILFCMYTLCTLFCFSSKWFVKMFDTKWSSLSYQLCRPKFKYKFRKRAFHRNSFLISINYRRIILLHGARDWFQIWYWVHLPKSNFPLSKLDKRRIYFAMSIFLYRNIAIHVFLRINGDQYILFIWFYYCTFFVFNNTWKQLFFKKKNL